MYINSVGTSVLVCGGKKHYFVNVLFVRLFELAGL